jgi:hypothetical protein
MIEPDRQGLLFRATWASFLWQPLLLHWSCHFFAICPNQIAAFFSTLAAPVNNNNDKFPRSGNWRRRHELLTYL